MYYKRKLQRAWKIMKRNKKVLGVLLVLILGIVLGVNIGRSVEKKQAEKEIQEVTAKFQKENQDKVDEMQTRINQLENADVEEELSWNLVLVNYKNPMEEGYIPPEMTEIAADYSVDSRIADAAKQMLADAKADGMKIIICSAYRSVDRQEQVFNASLQDRLNNGMEYWDAFEDTRLSVAEPGTSEHALGLALDLISNQYTELDEGQENTAEAQWLKENCHKYGFILRYPPEKTDITGIIYEPWHYRYVGVEDATKIMELGITLEEYLEGYY